ncbi:hypothetical protein [Pseudorhodoferax sp. Leaf265]|uniref:hypothetical protein n=1 Tax=Pseudorhodoferax sp. Leaf265 TaxID=1736315 RepID=UPI0012E730B2|nr:hypothetical protein [Pseudorhodoferax sp. Leaf265]
MTKMAADPPDQDTLRKTHDDIAVQARPLPYLAVMSSAHPLLVPERPFTEYQGLQAVQRVRHSNFGDALITYWASQDHFEMNRAALSDRIGATLALAGGLGPLATPSKPWWKRFTPLQILLTLSGIAGAIQVLVGVYEKLATPPELSVALEKPDGQHEIEGESFSAKVKLENFLSSVNHGRIEVEAVLRSARGVAIPLKVADSPLAGLGAGKSHTLTVVGQTPKRGTYTLEVTASAKAGMLSNKAPFKATIPFRSWAEEPEPFALRVDARPTFPIMLSQIEVGRDAPGGIECSTTLMPPKGGKLVMDWFLAKPQAADSSAFGTEVVVVRWTWPKLSARTTPVAEWSFKGVSLEEMKKLANAAQTHCIQK